MKLRHYLISVLALLSVASVQRAVADDNLPRFVIPTADFTDPGGSMGYAAITAGNPYFTIYMWVKNTDKQDTYWSKKPTLTVDGNSVYLDGFTNGTYD